MIRKLTHYLRQQPIHLFLGFIPIAIISSLLHWSDLVIFSLSALSIIPLASLIGESTEALAEYTGPRIGGLLNATLGNAAELIITIVAIREGLLELVKASITGSILGNILLVMGMSFLAGGLRHGNQSFDRHHAGRNSILLMLAVIALVIPSMLSSSIGPSTSVRVETLSLGVAATMIVLYAAGLIYGFKTPAGLGGVNLSNETVSNKKESVEFKSEKESSDKEWSLQFALIVLLLSTVGVAFLSELLVGAVEPVVQHLGVSEFFLGIILIPIIGNVAEHLVAVKMAMENKMDLSVEIAIASSLQIALFVAPLLVFVSLFLGNPLQLIFNQFELLALIVGVLIAALVSQDGESNWLEGAELLAVYMILALAFFLLPV
jgi:Ca2+:H+ antiporter